MVTVVDSGEGGEGCAREDDPFGILVSLFRSRRIELFVEIWITDVEFIGVDSNDWAYRWQEVLSASNNFKKEFFLCRKNINL